MGEPLQREGRAQDITAEPFEPLAVALVDPDAGVEREAFEESAAAQVRERVRAAQPPVHLGGLQRGQGVGFVVQVVAVV